MDIPQLKLLAGRVRSQLQQSSCSIGHSQSLDLIAALPGLRNWPEVMAFPTRVAACEVDITSVSRLAYRIGRKFSIDIEPRDLLAQLGQSELASQSMELHVWPGGAPSGVYVTTSETALEALLTQYEEATDGGLVYAERAANGWRGSIDLGEYGLWSSGIERLPAGTLLVVGPIRLDQSVWKDSAERMEMACLHALNSKHRVAVLVDTPTPDHVCEDIEILVGKLQNDGSDTHTGLRGIISEDGELQVRQPFSRGYPKPLLVNALPDMDAIPEAARTSLTNELASRTRGMVLFGSSRVSEHTAYEPIAAALALTQHAGPAARIMSRHRGTPAKDWMVPEPIKQLPFLPSIESAYAQGYRRMLIDAHYTDVSSWLNYDDVLFMGATYGHDVTEVALNLVARSGLREIEALQRIVAVLGVLHIEDESHSAQVADLFIRGKATGPVGSEWAEFEDFLKSNRVLSWEAGLSALLDSGEITMAGVRSSDPRNRYFPKFLAQREAGASAI